MPLANFNSSSRQSPASTVTSATKFQLQALSPPSEVDSNRNYLPTFIPQELPISMETKGHNIKIRNKGRFPNRDMSKEMINSSFSLSENVFDDLGVISPVNP